jgi:hypothetical protein
LLVEELRELFAGKSAFVAGNLFWYPLEGQPKVVASPDAMVVFGRPDADRRSYRQWLEGGIGPQVTFEVLSLSNRKSDLADSLAFYETHGVDEYYLIDPFKAKVSGWIRSGKRLEPVPEMNGFVSPRLGIRFTITDLELLVFRPDGTPFRDRQERISKMQELLSRQEMLAMRELHRADQEQERADEATRLAAKLAAKLKELGVDPESV